MQNERHTAIDAVVIDPNAKTLAQPSAKKVPVLLKVYAIALILTALANIVAAALGAYGIPMLVEEALTSMDATSLVINIIQVVLSAISCIVGIVLGVNLLRDKRRFSRVVIELLIAADLGILICEIMLTGLEALTFYEIAHIAFLFAVMVYIDPSLSEERKLQRKLADLEVRERAEEGTLGRDTTGKGYIELDFFNLFWIFVVCSVIGLFIETIYHVAVVDPGVYEDRTGMLFGPFSPIYGVGALLMTIALNRFHKANVVVIFLVSAVIGGAFEFLASWFFQFAFGIVAWDYTGTFLSIDGRTNGMFMAMWGVLGCFWIKLLLPNILELVNMIPWKWRYSLTTICAALMLVNIIMTMLAFDCWYQREAGEMPENAMEQFFEEHYDNEFMENHFQSMSIDPSKATRLTPEDIVE